ncbi:copper transporter [Plasmodium gaboni]|uniref:Copper transport protein n=1 Tax=Plasmodium gaboni TaxID=647221 RepID=A0A151LAI5_9APIC|nr:copper transporter [Plasmodium gaboni]KYN95984.1 copper transporter [Plasmodium gaboni]SOV19196.1 copper transporter [Plasmodium gaboni]SOV25111.1 copper transporter [Plasmodium sp. DRC-Itaito]
MCKNIYVYIILILKLFIVLANKGDNSTCNPSVKISCAHNCCKNKLSFMYNCWKHYDKYSNIIKENLQKEEDTVVQLQDNDNIDIVEHAEAMPMSFQLTTHTIILFNKWETKTALSYYISLVLCFFFGIISVGLKVVRLNVEHSLPKTNDTNIFKSLVLLKNNSYRMLLSFVIYSWDYLLMLIVMTFNVGLFVAVVLGLSFGFLIFGNKFVSSKKCSSDDLDVHKDFTADPACCGC